jgi:hypothetical protein
MKTTLSLLNLFVSRLAYLQDAVGLDSKNGTDKTNLNIADLARENYLIEVTSFDQKSWHKIQIK